MFFCFFLFKSSSQLFCPVRAQKTRKLQQKKEKKGLNWLKGHISCLHTTWSVSRFFRLQVCIWQFCFRNTYKNKVFSTEELNRKCLSTQKALVFDRTTNVSRLGACGRENEMNGSSLVFHTDIEESMLNWWSYSISWLTSKMQFALKLGYYWPLPTVTAACKGQTNLTSADLVPQLVPFAASYRWAIFPAMFEDWSYFTSLKLLMRICLHIQTPVKEHLSPWSVQPLLRFTHFNPHKCAKWWMYVNLPWTQIICI